MVTAAVISPPGWAGSPRRLSVCGAAVFSCKGCGFCRCVLRRGSGGAYHVACVYVPDSDTSFKVFALMNEREGAVFVVTVGIVGMCITALLMELWETLFAGRGKAALCFSMCCERRFP